MRGCLPFLVCILLACAGRSDTPLVVVQIGEKTGGRRVEWGADAKLTAKPWAESPQAGAIAHRLFREGGFSVFRIPIYALRPAEDPLYAGIAGLASAALACNPQLVLFASVANGDGDRANWLHGREKFPSDLLGGPGVYTLRHERYAERIDAYLDMMREARVPIDWLGIFNEDPGQPNDYLAVYAALRKAAGLQQVGLETWALRTGVTQAPSIAPLVDIIGSHFYDDTESRRPIPRQEWTAHWRALVQAAGGKPVWFTEATDFHGFEQDRIDELLAGFERLFPALNAGVTGVILYQVVPRFVNYDNQVAPTKWTALQALIHGTQGGPRRITTHDGPETLEILAYEGPTSETIELHIINCGQDPQRLRASNARGGVVPIPSQHLVWDERENGAVISRSPEPEGRVTLPARSYSVLRSPRR